MKINRSSNSFVSSDPVVQRLLFWRIFGVFGGVYLLGLLYRASFLEKLLDREFLKLVGFSNPAVVLGFLLLFFWIFERRWVKLSDLGGMTSFHWKWGGSLIVLLFGVSLFFTHPSEEMIPPIVRFMKAYPRSAGALLGIGLSNILIATFPLFTFIFLPAYLKKKRWWAIFLIFELVLFSSVLESVYQRVFNPPLTRVTAWMLERTVDGTYFDFQRNLVGAKDFSVYIGPACSGIGSLLLFSFLFAYTLWRFSAEGSIRWIRAFGLFATGLVFMFFLNAFRIMNLVWLGTYYPDLAMDMFHKVWGGFLFFIAFFPFASLLRKFAFRAK